MPKRKLEDVQLARLADEMNIAVVWRALRREASLLERVTPFVDPQTLSDDAQQDRYQDNLVRLVDQSAFIDLVDGSALDERDWILLAGVFHRRASDALFLCDHINESVSLAFGEDEIHLLPEEIEKILLCTPEDFEAHCEAMRGLEPPADRHAYVIGVMIAALQGYTVDEESPLAAFGPDLRRDIAAVEDAVDALNPGTDNFIELAEDKAEQIEAEPDPEDDIEELVGEEDLKQLSDEQAYFSSKEFVRNISITEEEYAADPTRWGEGVFVPHDEFRIPLGEGIVQEEFEFPTSSQIRFGWRRVSSWRDRSFDKAKDSDELIYNDASSRDVRASNLAVDDIKKQKVTLGMLKDELMDMCAGCTSRSEVEEVISHHSDSMLAGVFGSGDPRRAFHCFLDAEALRRGVYRFDPAKTQPFVDAFSEANRDALVQEGLCSLPVRNLAGIVLRGYLSSVPVDDISEQNSLSEVVDCYHDIHGDDAPIRLSDRQKSSIARAIVDMREIRASRTFLWHLRHPIDSMREFFQIVGAKRTAANVLGIRPADFAFPAVAAAEPAPEQPVNAVADEAKQPGKEIVGEVKGPEKEIVNEAGQPEAGSSDAVREDKKEQVVAPAESEPQKGSNDREPMDLDLGDEKKAEPEPPENYANGEPVKEPVPEA